MASKELKLSDLTASLEKLKVVLKEHAGIIFVVVVLAALVYSISSVNFVLSTASDEAYRDKRASEMTSTQFDKATIQKIQALGDRTSTTDPALPSGRINPFIE